MFSLDHPRTLLDTRVLLQSGASTPTTDGCCDWGPLGWVSHHSVRIRHFFGFSLSVCRARRSFGCSKEDFEGRKKGRPTSTDHESSSRSVSIFLEVNDAKPDATTYVRLAVRKLFAVFPSHSAQNKASERRWRTCGRVRDIGSRSWLKR